MILDYRANIRRMSELKDIFRRKTMVFDDAPWSSPDIDLSGQDSPGGQAGWAALVRTFAIQAPVRRPSCVSEKHISGSQREERDWTVFDKRYWPGDTFADHLTFALRQ